MSYLPPFARMNQIVANAARSADHTHPIAVPEEVVTEEVVTEEGVTEEVVTEEVVTEEVVTEEVVTEEVVTEEVTAAEEAPAQLSVVYDAKMKKVELLEVAAALGLEVSEYASKAEILAALDKATKPGL